MTRKIPGAIAILFLNVNPFATTITYKATLTEAVEFPSNASFGSGMASVTIDDGAQTLSVNFAFSDLVGTTTASPIHRCTPPPNAGTVGVATTTPAFVGFPLGVTGGTKSNTLDLTSASSYNPAFITAHGGTATQAEAALIAGIASGEAYLNFHTTVFPGGEIRGCLAPVPEPGAMILIASGLVGIITKRRNQFRA